MARTTLRHVIFSLTAVGLLSGCVEGSGTVTDGAAGGAVPKAVRVGQEIEAPEVFQANESALWDGRPSLGGTWVASPDAVDPERVVMFNPATGKSVNGALFRRERENPGPRLQLSSDAAEALGVLAGQPTEIKVTALRKQEAPEEVVVEAEPVEAIEGAAVEGAGVEAAAAEAAATDDAATAAAAVAALGAAGAEAGADAVADAAAEAVEPAPLTWKERRAKAKAEREAKKAAAAAAKAEAEALGSEAAAATVDTAGVAAIETAPLDARSPDIGAKPIADPAPAEAKAAEPAPAPSGEVRSIQIASFSKEENASRAVQALAKIGITAQIQKSDKGGKIVWGVVASGDAAMLQSIKDAGFADAYFLK